MGDESNYSRIWRHMKAKTKMEFVKLSCCFDPGLFHASMGKLIFWRIIFVSPNNESNHSLTYYGLSKRGNSCLTEMAVFFRNPLLPQGSGDVIYRPTEFLASPSTPNPSRAPTLSSSFSFSPPEVRGPLMRPIAGNPNCYCHSIDPHPTSIWGVLLGSRVGLNQELELRTDYLGWIPAFWRY